MALWNDRRMEKYYDGQAPGCEKDLEFVVKSDSSSPGCEKSGLGVGIKVGTAVGIRVDHALRYMATARSHGRIIATAHLHAPSRYRMKRTCQISSGFNSRRVFHACQRPANGRDATRKPVSEPASIRACSHLSLFWGDPKANRR